MKVRDVHPGTILNMLSCFAAALAAVLLSFSLCSETAGAATSLEAEGIDADRGGSITVQIAAGHEDWYVEGSRFRLYRVAELAEDLTFSYLDPYAETASSSEALRKVANAAFESDLSDPKNEDWLSAARTLKDLIETEHISADATTAMSSMRCTFDSIGTEEGLPLGIYLVQGDTVTEGTRTVTYQPQLILIPQRASAEDSWAYNITAEVKMADPTYVTETPSASPSVTNTATTTPTATPAGTNGRVSSPKTGDEGYAAALGALIMMAAALCVIVLAVRRKRM